MKRTLLLVLAALMLVSAFGCGKKPAEEDNTMENQAAYVSQLIDEIGEVTYASLSAINRAENFYKELTDEQKALVPNAGILTAARERYNELTSVPKLGSDRLDRNKFIIGTYYFKSSLWTEEHMQKLVDAGIDYVIGGVYNKTFLELADRYGVTTTLNYLPSWWGPSYVDRAAHMDEVVPISAYEQKAAAYTDYPAVWAMNIVDEPHADSLPYIGQLVEKCKELFPGKLPYVNLNSLVGINEIGRKNYEQYIAEFVQYVDVDYICYDYYMYDWGIDRSCLMATMYADACRKSGRDFWVVLQNNSKSGSYPITEPQLSAQAYTLLCYGARAIEWACWNAGWWEFNIVDENNNYNTTTYEGLKNVNAELHALSDTYMQYTSIATYTFGTSTYFSKVEGKNWTQPKQDVFTDIAISDNGDLLAGYFEKPDGSSYGLMLANVSEIYSGSRNNTVSFRVPHAKSVKAFINGETRELLPGENGVYSIEIASCDGAFITVERDERAVLDSMEFNVDYSVPAFDVQAFEFAVNTGVEKIDAELVKRLSDAGISFVMGTASNEAIRLLNEKGIGMFATNFYEYSPDSYLPIYGYSMDHAVGAVAIFKAEELVGETGLLLVVKSTPSSEMKQAAKSKLSYFNPYIPAIYETSGKRSISSSYFTALNTAAQMARENDKTLFISVQTGNTGDVDLAVPTAGEISWQIWNALAFGARKVILFDCAAMDGETFAEVAKTLAEIKKFKDVYANYTFEAVYGHAPDEKYSPLGVMAGNKGMPETDGITALSAEKSALFGIFNKTEGNGKALVIVPCDSASTLSGEKATFTATFTLDGTQKKVTLYQNGKATTLKGNGNTYSVTLTTCEGVFIAIE